MYDVIFKNGNVVDVKNEQILQADIAVKDGKIAGIGHFSGENVIDCTGKYITPGFIDAHVHIESSMATPMEFSKAVMPHGTTTVIADPHELVNVKGNEAMEYILDAAGDAPLGIYVMMPSSIPATPFETNGVDFTAEDMKQWKDHPLVLGLGEVMCYPAVLSKEEQIMKKLELCKGMVIDGHAPGLSGEDLKAYVEAGVMTDHECTSFEEAKEKCLAGMKILVREGSAARNVENIVPGLVKEPEFIAHFMFCTDDKHLDTIENEGHISYNIKKSIQLGMKPISAVKMATYNAAKTYGLNDIGVLEEGKDADIVILDSLESVEVHSVYKQGRIVNTEFFTKEAKPVNESMLHTVVLKNISKDKIQVKAEGKIPVIGMITALNELQQLYNHKSLAEDGEFALETLRYINEQVEEFKKEDGNLYAIYGTPAENLCGLQVKQFRKKYGVIENVSDREYVSNSFHCHVTEDITPIEKQDLEGRFWELCNGGKIQYVKYPINYNKEAVKTLVRRAMDKGFYEGVNLSLAYCDDCGHEELEMDVCPVCGSKNLTKIDRMNGYLSYSRVKGDTRLNDAKMAEIAERKSM